MTLLERPQRPQTAAPRRPGGRAGNGMLAIGSFVAGLAGKAFAKYGFATAGLITEWAAIAGGDLALYTRPERLWWPPAGVDGDEGAPTHRQGRQRARRGATLLLRVDGARGLDVQFSARQIIERINGYFGYAAIAELRILQGPIAPPGAGKKAPAPRTADANGSPPPAGEDAMLMRIGDLALRAALVRLGEGVRQSGRA